MKKINTAILAICLIISTYSNAYANEENALKKIGNGVGMVIQSVAFGAAMIVSAPFLLINAPKNSSQKKVVMESFNEYKSFFKKHIKMDSVLINGSSLHLSLSFPTNKAYNIENQSLTTEFFNELNLIAQSIKNLDTQNNVSIRLNSYTYQYDAYKQAVFIGGGDKGVKFIDRIHCVKMAYGIRQHWIDKGLSKEDSKVYECQSRGNKDGYHISIELVFQYKKLRN